ncbi:MAG: ATP-grasp domain-containing protein [Oscillospiraceae bacterium]|nr:ATP-grasp domain-containing protein [Oscillospiraceae bacterium]
MTWEMITAVAAVVAIIITILIYRVTAANEAKTRLIDKFNSLYYQTFSLREEISSITENSYGEEFFYELDVIVQENAVNEKVLDYLTEMEDFFFLVTGHRSVRKHFEKLMSFALYKRLLTLYGYIIYIRETTNNPSLFQNYEKALLQIRQMKKIAQLVKKTARKNYIGIRSSDAICAGNYFDKEIAIFSDESTTANFPVRPNQNKPNKYIFPYVTEKVEALIEDNSNCCFMFYNNTMAYNFPIEMYGKFICLNSKEILRLLNNKAEMRQWLSANRIPITPFEIYTGQDITLSLLRKRFHGAETYVIQRCSGGGGIGTFLVNARNIDVIKTILQPFSQYIVTEYIEKNISVNTHIFVSDKQTVLSPGSIQIVECRESQLCYRGADYIEFRSIPKPIQEKIKHISIIIANRLREHGYRGVAGIDYLVTSTNDVFCTEINPRFQASSFLLDLYLQKHVGNVLTAKSTFQINEQAFDNSIVSTLCFESEINLSCYYYYKDGFTLPELLSKRECLIKAGALVHDDGFMNYIGENQLDSSSYLFRAVFSHAICKISPERTLWVNDNISMSKAPEGLLDIKIALLNQGARFIGDIHDLKEGTYASRDIRFVGEPYCTEPVNINCAFNINLSRYSPYCVEVHGDSATVTCNGIAIGHADVEKDRLMGLPEIDRKILYLATDRLRIKMVMGCEFKSLGVGCRFCNLPISKHRFTTQEIVTALNNVKRRKLPFRHILIGGGTCVEPEIWDNIIELCHFLKNDAYFQDKPISLMSILPPVEKLQPLKNAGIEEVAFNLEISDDALAKELMPGKRSQDKMTFYAVLCEAVRVFGIGNVRSALLVGLEQGDTTVSEVRGLADIGVIPCLSAFRALPDSEYENTLHPTNEFLRTVYDKSSSSLAGLKGGICELGPQCHACRNNMLVI